MKNVIDRRRNIAGFSLIELLIVVAIIGVLAAIAYPGYRSFVIRSNRADVQQVLLQASQRAERYSATRTASGYGGFVIDNDTNNDLMRSPATGEKVYELAVVGTPGSTFTIRATPVSTGINKGNGYLEITSTGAKRWDRDNNGDTTGANENSWNR